jgi:hypothetical protein
MGAEVSGGAAAAAAPPPEVEEADVSRCRAERERFVRTGVMVSEGLR